MRVYCEKHEVFYHTSRWNRCPVCSGHGLIKSLVASILNWADFNGRMQDKEAGLLSLLKFALDQEGFSVSRLDEALGAYHRRIEDDEGTNQRTDHPVGHTEGLETG